MVFSNWKKALEVTLAMASEDPYWPFMAPNWRLKSSSWTLIWCRSKLNWQRCFCLHNAPYCSCHTFSHDSPRERRNESITATSSSATPLGSLWHKDSHRFFCHFQFEFTDLIFEQRDDLVALVAGHFQQFRHRRFGHLVISQGHVDFSWCRQHSHLLPVHRLYNPIDLPYQILLGLPLHCVEYQLSANLYILLQVPLVSNHQTQFYGIGLSGC